MKTGTENRTKTFLAVGLTAIALIVFFRNMVFNSGYSTSSPPVAQSTNTTTAPATATPAPAPRPSRQNTARNTQRGAKAAPAVVSQSLDPRLRLDLLAQAEQTKYTGSGRNIFSDQPPPPPAPKVVQQPVQQQPTGPPPPPPINLKFFGFASSKGDPTKKVFLSQGEDVFVAREGEIVQRRYKILRINQTSIDVEDVLTNNRQTIPLTAG